MAYLTLPPPLVVESVHDDRVQLMNGWLQYAKVKYFHGQFNLRAKSAIEYSMVVIRSDVPTL